MPALRPDWEELWAAVHARLPTTPAVLQWSDDVHALWSDPALFVSQACGWPLVTAFASMLRPIGTFDPRLSGARDGQYRSVIVARSGDDVAGLRGRRAAVNERGSLSGWVSLTVAAHGRVGRWDSDVVETGAHAASIDAVRGGMADVASIDAVTWALLRDLDRRCAAGLTVIARGPLVPCLPIVVPIDAPEHQVAALREAFAAACNDPATNAARRRLRIRRFVPMSLTDYAPVAALAASTRPA